MTLHQDLKQENINKYVARHRNRRKWLSAAVSLALVVAIITSYLLINPANTKTAKTYCGFEAHTHSSDCYGFEGKQTCELPEHEHTLQCFSDPQADKEDASVWQATLERAELTGVPNSDVLAVARTQLGYSESSRNYKVQEDGVTLNGYTRYGEWYGDAYGDWNTMFAAFCVDQAGVSMPLASSAQTWVNELSDPLVDLYYPSDEDGYSPESGDIVFFDTDKDTSADRTGVVSEVIRDAKTDRIIGLNTIEGDCAANGNNTNSVQYASYSIDDATIMGFGSVQQAACADTMAYMPLMLGASNPSSGVLVVSASDFQDPSTSGGNLTTQTQRVKNILTQIRNEYGNAYGFLAGGDYNWGSGSESGSKAGLDAVKSAVTDIMGNDVRMVFTQGNHDPWISELSDTGAYDTDCYGVYTINEDDYPQRGGNKADVQEIAGDLSSYLKAKADAGYDKPVFIITHVPLHYSTRCLKEGDAKYASIIYDAIAEYGDKLNIFFLYGHDHANGNDNYLGGAAVFLTRGDSIFISKEGDQSQYTTRTLNFTYMNCGFVGYYVDEYSSQRKSNADDTLTMAAFYIEGNKVTVSRWTVDGQYTYLKAAGVNATSSAGHGADKWPADTKTYTGSVVVTLPGEETGEDPCEDGKLNQVGDSGIFSCWDQLISADKITSGIDYDAVDAALETYYDPSVYEFDLYDITKNASATVPESGVKVYLPVDEAKSVFGMENGSLVWYYSEYVTVEGKGYMCFTANHFSLYGTAGTVSGFVFPESGSTEPTTETVKTFTEVSSLKDGDKVIIQNNFTEHYLMFQSTDNGLVLSDVSQNNAAVWTVEVYDSRFYLKNSSGNYLNIGNNTASTGENRGAYAQYVSGQNCWDITQTRWYNQNRYTYYLNDYYERGTRASGYTQSASQDRCSAWKIYKVTEEAVSVEYWVRCNSTSDFTTDGTYMIIRDRDNETVKFALGTANDSHGAAPTITSDGTSQGRTRYRISGAGSGTAYQWTFSSISNGTYTLRNVGNNTQYLRLNQWGLLNNSGNAVTITNPNSSDKETWQIRNGNYYLRYNNSSFVSENNSNQTYMHIYRKVSTVTYQLAVQKFVPEFTSYIDEDTQFTFRLVKSNTNYVANATACTGSYELYDYEGTKIGTGTLGSDGTFTLKGGQTALFTITEPAPYYFVEEAVSENVVSVTAKVNGDNATLGTAGNGAYNYVPAVFNDNRSLVTVTNTSKEDIPGLLLSLNIEGQNKMGSGTGVTEDSIFGILITNADGTPAAYTDYVYVEEKGTPSEGKTVTYDESNPVINLHPGDVIRINGLEKDKTYTVYQYLGDVASCITDTKASAGGKNVVVTRAGSPDASDNAPEYTYFDIEYNGHMTVEVIDDLGGIITDENGNPVLVNKVPDHHKYIDAFRDGEDNPETDLDDKARAGQTTDPIQDLYRLYLDVGPESAYQALDVLFIIDSSTSMSGFTGYDAVDILGKDSWRCWALDTLLLGEPLDAKPVGSGTKYEGSGTQRASMHQREMCDNGLFGKIADLHPDSMVAVARFSATSEPLVEWTNASSMVKLGGNDVMNYSNISGTNYAAGLMEALDFLDEVKDDGSKKVMIFISDGLPTRYYTSLDPDEDEFYDPAGSGSEDVTEFNETQDRIEEFLGTETVSSLIDSGELEIFTIAVGTGVFQSDKGLDARALLKQLSTNNECFNSTNFRDIMRYLDAEITNGYGHYTDLMITDTLSAYVDFYTDDLDMLVEKIDEDDGTKETLYEKGALTEDGLKYIKEGGVVVDTSSKTVTVDFKDEYKEEGGFIYRISFNVKTTQTAYNELSANVLAGKDGYDGTTGMGTATDRKTDYESIIKSVTNTNKTSSGMPGFHSNDHAVLEYTQVLAEEDGKTSRVEFLHPVVQVWTCDLVISKEWGDSTDAESNASVTVNVMMKALPENYVSSGSPISYEERTGGTQIATVTLNKANGWTYTLKDLPKGYYYYIVEDTSNWPNYSQIYTPYAVAVPHDGGDEVEFEVGVTNIKNDKYIELVKTDMEGKPLSGAEFKLYSDTQHQTEVHAGELITSGTDGVFTPENFKLDNGTYYITETKTPKGYNTLTSDVRIVVTDEDVKAYYNDNLLDVTKVTSTDGTSTAYTIKIPNSSGYDLPETGGHGILPYTLCGMLLMAAAVYIYVSRRKSERRSV